MFSRIYTMFPFKVDVTTQLIQIQWSEILLFYKYYLFMPVIMKSQKLAQIQMNFIPNLAQIFLN